MSEFIFTSYVASTYKKAYKQHYDKVYPLYKSKEIEVGGKVYVLVGQSRLKKHPLLSDFDIFDENGTSADESIGQMIHDYIGKMSMTLSALYKLKDPLAKQVEEAIPPSYLKETFAIKDEEITLLTESLNIVNERLNALIGLVETLFKKEQWDENNIKTLERKWNDFFNEYESRARLLLDLAKQSLKEKKEEANFENELVNNLWEEARVIYDADRLYSPLRASVGSFSADELIEHNYQYGRFRQSDTPMKKTNKLGRGLYWFVLYFYRFSVWVFIPFMFYALWLDDSLTIKSAFPFVIFGIIGSKVKNINKHHLLGKVNTVIAERRAVVSQNQVGSSDKTKGKLKESDSLATGASSTLYETKVFAYHVIYWIIAFFCIFIVPPVYSYFSIDDTGIEWVIYPLLVAAIAIITTIYPFQILSWKRFVVGETFITLGKKKFGVKEIKEMRFSTDKEHVYIYVYYSDNPFKLGVEEGKYKELAEVLERFCTKYHIPFKRKS